MIYYIGLSKYDTHDVFRLTYKMCNLIYDLCFMTSFVKRYLVETINFLIWRIFLAPPPIVSSNITDITGLINPYL